MRKKFSEELEVNMQGWVISKQAHHERVSRKMIRAMDKQMSTTMSDGNVSPVTVTSFHLITCMVTLLKSI